MRRRTRKHLVGLLGGITGFVLGLTITQFTLLLTSKQSQPAVTSAPRLEAARSNEILNTLIPNGVWADSEQLEKFEKSEMVSALKEVEATATGDRALAIAFLLAALNEDYARNSDKLLRALVSCRAEAHPTRESCADNISSYLVELSQRGDVSLLAPLLDVSDLADGAFQSRWVFTTPASSMNTRMSFSEH